jgi:hypothetical protein
MFSMPLRKHRLTLKCCLWLHAYAAVLHRFDVYMQLRGLLTCEYNPAAPLYKAHTAASGESSSSSNSSSELLGYAEAQSAAFDAVDSTAAFGVSEVRHSAYLSLLSCDTANLTHSCIAVVAHARYCDLLQCVNCNRQVAQPVVAYLDALYASSDSSQREQAELMQHLRSIVDATVAAPTET